MSLRGSDRRHDRRVRRRRHREGHGRQGRPGRGAARHRLQVRGRDPGPRAVDPPRPRPARDRRRSATRSKPSSSRRRTRKAASSSRRSAPSTSVHGATIEQIKESSGVVKGPVIEVVKGGLILDIGLRGFLPASLVELRRVRDLQPYIGQVLEAKIIELDKNRNNVVLSRRAWLEETQKRAAWRVPRQPEAGRDPQGRRLLGRQLRCLRRPRRHGRARARLRAVVEARRPPVVGRRRRRRGHRAGARRRPRQGAHQPVAEGDAGPTRGRSSPRTTASASSSTAASPSSSPSAPSCRSATASRASCTSRRWRPTTSTCPSRS